MAKEVQREREKKFLTNSSVNVQRRAATWTHENTMLTKQTTMMLGGPPKLLLQHQKGISKPVLKFHPDKNKAPGRGNI